MDYLLSGTISVKAALEEGRTSIEKLMVNPKKRSRDIAYLIAIAKKNNIPVEFCEGAAMNELSRNNGGVILQTGPYDLPALDPFKKQSGLCFYVSGVEDPYNLGSIARTLYAAGAKCMILLERDWNSALPILARSSAGAWLRLPIYTVSDEEQLLEFARNSSLPLVCASRDDAAKPLFESPLDKDCLIAVGGAMRGLSSKILEASPIHRYIPYGREFRNALDSVSAASVFAFYWTQTNA